MLIRNLSCDYGGVVLKTLVFIGGLHSTWSKSEVPSRCEDESRHPSGCLTRPCNVNISRQHDQCLLYEHMLNTVPGICCFVRTIRRCEPFTQGQTDAGIRSRYTPQTTESKPLKNISANHVTSFLISGCLLYTSPSPRDLSTSRMPSSA